MKRSLHRIIAILLALTLMLTLFTGCELDIMDTLTDWAKAISAKLDEENGVSYSEKETLHSVPVQDMDGHPISFPKQVNRIASLSVGVTDTLISLGLGSKLAVVDTVSAELQGVPSAINTVETLPTDEELTVLTDTAPDVLFITEKAYARLSIAPEITGTDENGEETETAGVSPLDRLKMAGICVCCVPEAKSLAAVMDSILFVGYCFEKYDESEALVYTIIEAMEKIQTTAKEVTNVRTVYVELEPFVSVGFGELLNEMIEMCGAQNVFLSRDNIIRVDTEEVAAANPQIIITCVGDLTLGEGETIHTVGEARMAEISAREGWQDISAVVSGTIYYMESGIIPGPSIIPALNEMAAMCYPRLFS